MSHNCGKFAVAHSALRWYNPRPEGEAHNRKQWKYFYANSRIEKICTNDKVALKELGRDGAKVLKQRLEQMRDVANLGDLRILPGAWHELTGDRKGQLACSITKLKRLVFLPANDPVPIKPDGGLDWSGVTAVMNVEIVDYH